MQVAKQHLTALALAPFSSICRRNDFSDVSEPPLFPQSEQRAIAAFLDRKTAKIDALVAKKERLIELLQEKRTALITRAVTRGLDPSVPMKDSGIEWLGEIPAHWNVTRIKNLSPFVTSGSRGWAEFYSDEGPLFLRIGNVQSESVDLDLDEIQHVRPAARRRGGTDSRKTRRHPGVNHCAHRSSGRRATGSPRSLRQSAPRASQAHEFRCQFTLDCLLHQIARGSRAVHRRSVWWNQGRSGPERCPISDRPRTADLGTRADGPLPGSAKPKS